MERKEAIEIVRKLYNESLFMKKDKEAMVTLIPELKESEDGRIRKALINVFSTHQGYEVFFGASVEDILAWLEKQVEQKPTTQYNHAKFREGDTVQKITGDKDIVTIAEVDTEAEEYRLTNTGFIPFKYEHLWHIVEEKPTKEQVWDYCNKISSEWWQITMDKWNTLADEDKNKYNQFIGFNDFSDMLMNITAGALFQLIDTGKLEYEEGSLLLEKPDDTPKPLEVINAMNERQGEQNPVGGNKREIEINLVEILKHYPRETELYSPLYGKLWLAEVNEEHEIITCYKYPLDEGCTRAILEQEDTVSFYSNGTTGLPDFSISKDCMLFLYNIEKQGG